jgi:hypothetical protein
MFSLEADFSMQDLEDLVNGGVESWIEDITEIYRQTGLQFAERARAKAKPEAGAFGNITWNLRSSIGFLLIRDGIVIESYFPTLSTGAEGSKTGDDYAREIALLVSDAGGLIMVLVAGMEYAYFVESKGLDVISVSSETFEKELKEMLA